MSDVDRPDGNGDGPEFDAIPAPVVDAIGRLERAAATHDREEIAAAVRALVDHYGVDAELPVAVDPHDVSADDPRSYEVRQVDAEHSSSCIRSAIGGLRIDELNEFDLPAEVGAGVDRDDVRLRAEANGRDPDAEPYAVTSVRLDPDAARTVAVGLLEAADEAEQRRALAGDDETERRSDAR